MGRKRKKTKKRKFFTTKVLMLLILALFCLFLFLGVSYKIYNASVFKLTPESIQANFEIDKKEISDIMGKSIFNLNLESIRSQIKKQHPQYKEVDLFKKFPNTIEIRIKKREPVAQIDLRNFYLIDREGIVINQGNREYFQGYPLLTGIAKGRSLTKGENLYNWKLEDALAIIDFIEEEELLEKVNSLAQDYQFQLDSINVASSQAVYFYLKNKKTESNQIRIIVNRDEIKKKITLLGQLMTQKLKDKIPLIRYIDFRFQKVVVGFNR